MSRVIGSDFSTGTGRVLTTMKRKWEVGLWEPLIMGPDYLWALWTERAGVGWVSPGQSFLDKDKDNDPSLLCCGGPRESHPVMPAAGFRLLVLRA